MSFLREFYPWTLYFALFLVFVVLVIHLIFDFKRKRYQYEDIRTRNLEFIKKVLTSTIVGLIFASILLLGFRNLLVYDF